MDRAPEKYPEANKNYLRANAWTLAAADSDNATWAPFSCEDARRLNLPLLLLQGESSPGNYKTTLDNVQACLPRSTRDLISNSSHSMPRMNPEGFNSAVMSFIAAH
jgi:pimeloyl-ACP methyl ester carboxylesterase